LAFDLLLYVRDSHHLVQAQWASWRAEGADCLKVYHSKDQNNAVSFPFWVDQHAFLGG
jgi:hypothetical protein